ncbi:MAG TPA: glycosyltransferase family 9 protein [Gammaproteobacteria bacterium]|jgi:ADP-heptose:LPS heptosyltransferase|nr:glycosyltransferase family 9 protein [Gammaproteobacteria bacterium]
MPASAGPRILVIRNDKLGDFMLAWPALALLRKNLPKARIAVLVPAYTAPLAEACPYVDEVVLDPRLKGAWRNGLALARALKPMRFDAVVTLFSRFDTGLGAWLAGIPLRYAPATKLAQLFYNRRIPQRRSRSEKPEYEYNLDLAAAYLREQGVAKPKPVAAPYLEFKSAEVQKLKRAFLKQHKIAAGKQLVFLHAGHGGSANNLSLGQYGHLARDLAGRKRHLVLTAGPAEEAQARRLSSLLEAPHTLLVSKDGLLPFAKHLAFADLFVSGSTGPLHLAAALDRPTAAFYPRRRSSTALRWQTVNGEGKRLAFMPPEGAEEGDMGSIDVAQAAVRIAKELL